MVTAIYGSNAMKSRTAHHHITMSMEMSKYPLSGVDVRMVQGYFGHARLDTTKIYLRLVDTCPKEDYHRAMPEIEVGMKPAPDTCSPPSLTP